LTTFIEELNSQHNTIRFELNYSHDAVNFLDTTVYIDTAFKTIIKPRPTAKNQYLHFTINIQYMSKMRYHFHKDCDFVES